MVDIRDIATIAVLAILDQEAVGQDPVFELVGPDNIMGTRGRDMVGGDRQGCHD